MFWTIFIAALVIGPLTYWVIRKGRPMEGDHVFRASRLTKGNRIFPSQVGITASAVTMRKPQWIGKLEESIHIAHVASIKIDTNVLFSDMQIETSGGQQPVVLHGHSKGDAIAMKAIIEKFQSEYYKKP